MEEVGVLQFEFEQPDDPVGTDVPAARERVGRPAAQLLGARGRQARDAARHADDGRHRRIRARLCDGLGQPDGLLAAVEVSVVRAGEVALAGEEVWVVLHRLRVAFLVHLK